MFENFAKIAADWAAQIPFDALVWIIWGTFAAIFLAVLILTLTVPAMRTVAKKPFLCLSYAYTALTFAAFLLVNDIRSSAFVACVFWIAAFALYGILCALSGPRRKPAAAAPAAAVYTERTPAVKPRSAQTTGVAGAVASNNVRLEHAIAVTDRLLEKNLGKTDRQELEKLKNTLEVMKIKGNLSPAENEILNENFNTLLKLMAKYNI